MSESRFSTLRAPLLGATTLAVLKTTLLCALFTSCTLHAQAQSARPTQPQDSPATPPQGDYAAPAPPMQPAPARRRGVRLPPLRPRPGYIIGRAVFADGRPIPNFTVQANTHIGPVGGKAVGSNGRYTMPMDPNVILVTDIIADAHLTYQGQEYVLQMYPTDGKPDGLSSNRFVGNAKVGIVRDFVFHLTGVWPGYPTNPPPPNVASNDNGNGFQAFEGHTINVLSGLGRDAHPTLVITLTPTGPMIDGSQGAVIQRQIPNVNAFFTFRMYDLPLGTYTATASELAPDGTQKPHKLLMRVGGTPIGSGDTPLDFVTVTWPADAGRKSTSDPTLTVMP